MRGLLMLVATVATLWACGDEGYSNDRGFLPRNNLHLFDSYTFASMTQSEFNQAISEMTNLYRPIIRNLGYNIVITGAWTNSEVNAYIQKEGDTFQVVIFGGIGRRPEISIHSLKMIIAHEIGHALAGAVFYSGDTLSTEGTSDSFATHSAAKKVFSSYKEDVKTLSSVAVNKCKSVYQGQSLRVCYWTMLSSKELADLLGALNGERASFENLDTTQVSQTLESHPSARCRLTEYFYSAVCTKKWDDTVIPQTMQEHYEYGCEYSRCWYAP
jgi:hypothetical protein